MRHMRGVWGVGLQHTMSSSVCVGGGGGRVSCNAVWMWWDDWLHARATGMANTVCGLRLLKPSWPASAQGPLHLVAASILGFQSAAEAFGGQVE